MSHEQLPHRRGEDPNFAFFLRFCRTEFPVVRRHFNLWEDLLRELWGEHSPHALVGAMAVLENRKDMLPRRWDNLSRYYRALLGGLAEDQQIENSYWAALGSNNTVMIGGYSEPE